MQPPQLDPDVPFLADVVPSVLAAMDVAGFDRHIELPGDLRAACVLLIDGLGDHLLAAHPRDAPVLSGLHRRSLQVGFPSTTVASLAAVGTGCRAGAHGMVGYTFRHPDAGVVNPLRWRPQPWGADLRDDLPPEQVQPLPTTFERATAAGLAVSIVSKAEFTGSGLTRAVLRGGRYVGVHGLGDLAASIGTVLTEGGFCYGYHGDLDLIGHLHGPGSVSWRMQLRQVDRLVESIVESLPPGALLAVVADHGMVQVTDDRTVDLDRSPALLDGVVAVAGEARARYVYVADGAADAVLATWRDTLGDKAWVLTRDEAIAAGWFGDRIADEMRPRIGDIVAAARDTAAMVRRSTEPVESGLRGQHGSLTPAEQLVPLLVAHA
ncbi:alkaline phosphatase family protein [Mycobacterium sp. PS03-16]|uniref:alkaline phosphatase family protein n=1 Tax=Mycobacterium sp. PS03-16 TaxID=2559611 RepID=UPI001072EDE1|nr:nucleotide pyrophosphatase/phosphodiesterase family protein [Mycobacterium sp. PS03-16]TFV54105.1 alkaline phosphatase family protein [Mycobacterium sp. PS03-16]